MVHFVAIGNASPQGNLYESLHVFDPKPAFYRRERRLGMHKLCA